MPPSRPVGVSLVVQMKLPQVLDAVDVVWLVGLDPLPYNKLFFVLGDNTPPACTEQLGLC